MEALISIFTALRSPRASAITVLFCLLVLYTPYDKIKISRPEFVENYQAVITTVLLVSLSVLIVESILLLWSFIKSPFLARRNVILRKNKVKEIFNSLNLDELCVIYAMAESGTLVVKAPYSNHIMLSLRQKGALCLAPGQYSMIEFPHIMPDDVFQLVQREGLERFPEEFRNSTRFNDEVRQRVDNATNPRNF